MRSQGKVPMRKAFLKRVEEKKKVQCRMCYNKHVRGERRYICKYRKRKGHKLDKCWTGFPHLRPGGLKRDRSRESLGSREATPHTSKKQ